MSHRERIDALAQDPDAELRRLEAEVRKAPGDAKLRTYLFQLLAIRGDWERALSQLQVAGQLDAKSLAMAQTYREAIRAEVYRGAVFAGRMQPSFLGTPPAWAGLLVESLKLLGEGQVAAAEKARAQALDAAEPTAGRIGDAEFEWIADADSRIGPVCEAIVDGKYVWIPFEILTSVVVDAPADLRDLVWSPAQLRYANGGESVALLPARYPGSESSDDPAIRVARKTEWKTVGPATWTGLGQRMWATDAGEYPVLEARDITLSRAA